MAQKYLFIAILCVKMSRVNKALTKFFLNPGDVTTHVLVGDELHCQVVKRNNLPYFTIVMEDEDFVEGSKGSTKTR